MLAFGVQSKAARWNFQPGRRLTRWKWRPWAWPEMTTGPLSARGRDVAPTVSRSSARPPVPKSVAEGPRLAAEPRVVVKVGADDPGLNRPPERKPSTIYASRDQDDGDAGAT